ncbi:hypothetical protein PGB90_001236 [Kerria lacca]
MFSKYFIILTKKVIPDLLGIHVQVSLVSRIIPSPDWFIGLDSFNLCVNGNWLDSITVEADPMDAGTDNGFTFTAPNWPTQPQGVVFRMSNKYPSHPAGSFYYPQLKRLPPIATFQFIKFSLCLYYSKCAIPFSVVVPSSVGGYIEA